MSKASRRSSVTLPSVQANRAITAAAKADAKAQPLTPRQLKAMVPFSALLGRPKLANPR